jgi:hypothetical protein
MWIVTRRATDGLINSIGRIEIRVSRVLNELFEAHGRMTPDTVDSARSGRDACGDRVPGILPFGNFGVIILAVVALRAITRVEIN